MATIEEDIRDRIQSFLPPQPEAPLNGEVPFSEFDTADTIIAQLSAEVGSLKSQIEEKDKTIQELQEQRNALTWLASDHQNNVNILCRVLGRVMR